MCVYADAARAAIAIAKRRAPNVVIICGAIEGFAFGFYSEVAALACGQELWQPAAREATGLTPTFEAMGLLSSSSHNSNLLNVEAGRGPARIYVVQNPERMFIGFSTIVCT